MLGLVTSSANKIAARYRARSAAAGVFGGRGAAGAGRIAAQLAPVGLDVGLVVGSGRIVQIQAVSGARLGGVASSGVASLRLCLRFQRLVPASVQIASFATGSRARVPAAAGADPGRSAGGGRPPRTGAGARLYPRCAWRRSPAKVRSIAPLEAVKAQQGLKNHEEISAPHGVGGSSRPESATFWRVKRLNSCAKARQGCGKLGRGVSNPAHLWWGKAASVCGGRNRVN